MTFNLMAVYTVSVALSHVLFAVIVLRLYQLVKKTGWCRDSLILRLGIVLVVTGTLTLASIPVIDLSLTGDQAEATMFWSIVRTAGLIVLCFVIFKTIIRLPSRHVLEEMAKRK